ncbi:MAG: co-chaperone GroES family protein [Planctomycetia bacterium]|nr:co-chaperone GroES family protein [Planctomycetia bacterium]
MPQDPRILNMAGEAVLADRANTEKPARVVDPMRVRPRGDQVLVRRLQDAEVTKGGLILPMAYEKDFFHAEILAVGPGHWDGGVLCPIDLKPGDIVLVDEERKSPDGIIRKHLIPVTPDEKNICLMLEGYARAVIQPEMPTEEHGRGECAACRNDK